MADDRCCCCHIKTGAIIVAIITIISGIITIANGWSTNSVWTVGLAGTLGGVLNIIAGVCLLVGVVINNTLPIAVYLVIQFVSIILECIALVMFVINKITSWESDGDFLSKFIGGILVFVIAILLALYFLYVAYRAYRYVKTYTVSSTLH